MGEDRRDGARGNDRFAVLPNILPPVPVFETVENVSQAIFPANYSRGVMGRRRRETETRKQWERGRATFLVDKG